MAWKSAYLALFHAIHRLRRGEERSALGIPQRRAVDADRVALMPEATEEGLDERFVAKKRLPLGVVQIRSDNCGPSAVTFLHQFEKDVGLLGFQIEIAELVDKCAAPHLAERFLSGGAAHDCWEEGTRWSAATVDKKRLGLNRCTGAWLCGLNGVRILGGGHTWRWSGGHGRPLVGLMSDEQTHA